MEHVYCPYCSREILETDKICPHCRNQIFYELDESPNDEKTEKRKTIIKKVSLVLIPLALLLVLWLIISIVFGFGKSSKLKDASNKAISIGTQVVEVVDSYLDNKILNDTAQDKVDALLEELNYVNDLTESDENYPDDLYMQINVLGVSTAILFDDMKHTDETYDGVLKARNELAEDLGMSSR